METVFGFVPVINGVSVFFKHRDKLFSDNNVKDLNSSFSSFQYKVASSRIYSFVRVGYDKQDYESMNGRDEFRFTTEYTTGKMCIRDRPYPRPAESASVHDRTECSVA